MSPVVSAFLDALGRIILSNAKMQELCRILTGNYLQNFEIFRDAINSAPVQKKYYQVKFRQQCILFTGWFRLDVSGIPA